MLRNYLKIASRNLVRNKGQAAINVAGLGVGLAACLVIGVYVWQELQYDRFHEMADRIVRVQLSDVAVTPSIVAPLFKRSFPEAEEAARLYDVGSFRPQVLRYGDHAYEEERFFYADSAIFNIFTLPLQAGNPQTALVQPRSLVLSASMATKYFRNEDPIGKIVRVGPEAGYEVTGVFEDLPPHSHLQFDFLASFSSLTSAQEEIWSSANYLTYLLLREPHDLEPLETKIDLLIDQIRADGQVSASFDLELVPLTRIHLGYEGREKRVYLFATLAFLILLVACANYMNLATAQSASRAREVGVRKAVGAHRGQLIGQFYMESAMLVGVAMFCSLLIARIAWPLLPSIRGHELVMFDLTDPVFLLLLIGIGLLVILISGSYPAAVLSSCESTAIFKGGTEGPRKDSRMRQGLVVFQFAVCIFLIASTTVAYNQLRFVQTTNLGFDREHVVVLPMGDSRLHDVRDRMVSELEQHRGVQAVSAVDRIPGYQVGGYSLTIEGLQLPEGELFPIAGVPTDQNVVDALGLELVAGDGFPSSEAYAPEPGNYVYLVNCETIRQLGWTPEGAIGRRMTLSGDNRMGTLVGVFKDYHFLPLHEPIRPMAMFVEPQSTNALLVRSTPGQMAGALASSREIWQRLVPHRPFTYSFLDQQLNALYHSEQQTGRLFAAFSILAVLIACLGLYGLAAHVAEERRKEIGIRKVLGATVQSIIALLSKDFIKLVLCGFILAVPIAYYVMSRWLDNFAYGIEIGPAVFMMAGIIAATIALMTVSYQALRAARMNPTEAIRNE